MSDHSVDVVLRETTGHVPCVKCLKIAVRVWTSAENVYVVTFSVALVADRVEVFEDRLADVMASLMSTTNSAARAEADRAYALWIVDALLFRLSATNPTGEIRIVAVLNDA